MTEAKAPAPQTFTVRNSGSGTLNYQVSANRPWLSVSPASGASTGAANAVTVSVNTAGLSPGEHNGEIRVSGTGESAQVAPAVLAVRLSLTEVASVSAATFQRGAALAAESIATAFGVGLAAATEVASVIPLPTTLAGTSVRVRDSLGIERVASLFFVSSNQVNYLVPEATAPGLGTVTVLSGDQVVGTGALQVAAVAPGLFTANASGRGAGSSSGSAGWPRRHADVPAGVPVWRHRGELRHPADRVRSRGRPDFSLVVRNRNPPAEQP